MQHETLEINIRNTTIELDPHNGTIRWIRSWTDSGAQELKATVQGFDHWDLEEKTNQHVRVRLGGERFLEAYVIGVTRLIDCDATFENLSDTGDFDAWPFKSNVKGNWWLTSDHGFSLADGLVDHTGLIGVFHHDSDAPDVWAQAAVSEDKHDRLIGSMNTTRFLLAMRHALWLRIDRAIHHQLPRDTHLRTAERGMLDAMGHAMNLGRRVDESDEAYRIRLIAEARVRFGGESENDIIGFMAAVIQASPTEFTIVNRNRNDDGRFEPATFQVAFDFDLLFNLGFEADEFQEVIDELNDLLVRVSAAGVNASVLPQGGATWDSTDTWDSETAVWGT